MVSLTPVTDASGTYWRLRWREAGRGSKARSKRFTDEANAINAKLALESQAESRKGNRIPPATISSPALRDDLIQLAELCLVIAEKIKREDEKR